MISVESNKGMYCADFFVSSGILTDVGEQVGTKCLQMVSPGDLIPNALEQECGFAVAF